MILILLLQLLAPSLSKNHHNKERGNNNATPSATQSPSLPVAALAAPGVQQGQGSGRGPQFLELLSKMGLPGPPQEEEEEVDSKRKQVPAFLMEMYRQSDRTFSTGLSSITSFPALHENKKEEDSRFPFRFDITDLLNSEDIGASQFRVYKVKGSRTKESSYRVNVFHVTTWRELELSPEKRHYMAHPFNASAAIRLLDSKILESRQAHWVSFEVTKAIRLCQDLLISTANLEVAFTPINPVEVSPSSRGIRFTRSRGRPPSLIVYVMDDYSPPNDDRDTRDSRQFDESTTYDTSSTACQKRALYIDFTSLGWRWIVAPRGFDAFMCSGECGITNVVSQNSKVTNHAYLQAVMESMYPSIPKPCCSPTKLKSLSIILNTNNNFQVKVYHQMVVESCGCE